MVVREYRRRMQLSRLLDVRYVTCWIFCLIVIESRRGTDGSRGKNNPLEGITELGPRRLNPF